MFVYINPVNFKRKSRKIIYSQRIDMEDKYYFSQILPIIKGKADWRGLIFTGSLLVPKALNPPQNLPCFGSAGWKAALAAEKLKTKLKARHCDLIFCDKQGIYSGLLIRLAELARSTCIKTDNPNYYKDVRDKIYTQFGCYMQINTYAGLREGYTFSAEPDYSFQRVGFKLITYNSLSDSDIVLPQKFKDYIPSGVLPCDFAEALYSACGVGKISDYIKK